MDAVRSLLQPLSIGAFQWNSAKQYNHYQVQPPDLVRLPETVNTPHLPLLVGVAKDARCMTTSRCDAVDEIFAAVLCDVLSQLRQQPRRPFLLRICLFRLQNMYRTKAKPYTINNVNWDLFLCKKNM